MSEDVLLVTHARSDGIYDSGLLEGSIEPFVKDFKGLAVHISSDPETHPYGGKEIYDEVVIDRWQGMPNKNDCRKILENCGTIYRAGAQFSKCCGNTDMGLSVNSEQDLELVYLEDLTVCLGRDSLELLEDRSHYHRSEGVNINNNLNFNYIKSDEYLLDGITGI